jgi:hypothetical protein
LLAAKYIHITISLGFYCSPALLSMGVTQASTT